MVTPKEFQSVFRVALTSLKKEGVSNTQIQSLVQHILQTQNTYHRSKQATPLIPVTGPSVIPIREDVSFRPHNKEIRYQDRIISLSPSEANLLYTFLKFRGEVLTYSELVQGVSPKNTNGDKAGIVRVWLHRLRNKLDEIPQAQNWIKSVQGKGYYFSTDSRPS